jgi:hypothetical protein
MKRRQNILGILMQPRTLLLAAGLVLFSGGALVGGPTDDIAACIVDSYDESNECLDTVSWYQRPLCILRFEADAVLCALIGGLPT